MPLTNKGNKIMDKMRSEYGPKGKSVFYASRNKGTIHGVDPESSGHHKMRKLVHARRSLEDHMREQEDALFGGPDEHDTQSDEPETPPEKRGKLGKKGPYLK